MAKIRGHRKIIFRSCRAAGIGFVDSCRIAKRFDRVVGVDFDDMIRGADGVVDVVAIPYSCGIHDVCGFDVSARTRRGWFDWCGGRGFVPRGMQG